MNMNKSVNGSEMDNEDMENLEVRITSQISELVPLKDMVEKSNKKVEHWLNQTSKLCASNSNIEMNYCKLTQDVSDVEAKLMAGSTVHVAKKQELKDFQNARANISHVQWEECKSETEHYADFFSNWTTEYCRNVLMKDIEHHRGECKRIGDELAILKRELDDMKVECDPNYIEANTDVNDLQNFNSVITHIKLSNSNLVHTVTLTEDTLSRIQYKIKQSKIVFNEYETKEKAKMF